MAGIRHSIFRIRKGTRWPFVGLVTREDSEVVPLERFEPYDITVERF